DRVVYAAALADLAAMTTPRLALAASDGSLVARVRRILGQPRDRRSMPVGWTPALLALLLCGALVPIVAARMGPVEPQPAQSSAGPLVIDDLKSVEPEPQEPTASQLRAQLEEAKKALADMQRRLDELAGTGSAQ